MKKVFSLLLVVAMLASLSLVAFAAPANEAGGMHTVITETDEGITVTVYANNVVDLSGFLFNLQTTAITYAGDLKVNEAFDQKVNDPSSTSLKIQYAATDAANYITNAGSTELFSFKATKADADATLTEADFAYGTKINNLSKLATKTGSTIAGISAGPSNFATNKTAAQAYFTIEYVDARTPIVENPFSATASGTTITCIGKVDASATNYGVVFTAASTLDGARAQKFYGAMDGDTVSDGAEGTRTFTFGDWDGSFQIILEGVHAGEKELDFFVNDTVIEDTNFTLTVE